MTTPAGSISVADNPWKDVKVILNGLEQQQGEPLELNIFGGNTLTIVSPLLEGKELQIGLASGDPTTLIATPPYGNGVIAGPEGAQWNLRTQSVASGDYVLVLYSKEFEQVLELFCSLFLNLPPHPWYSTSVFVVIGPTWGGMVPHLAMLPVIKDGSLFTIMLKPIGESLLGKDVSLKLSGSDNLPIVTPASPQRMIENGVAWKVQFSDRQQLTATFTAPGVILSTVLHFVPSAEPGGTNSSSELDYTEVHRRYINLR